MEKSRTIQPWQCTDSTAFHKEQADWLLFFFFKQKTVRTKKVIIKQQKFFSYVWRLRTDGKSCVLSGVQLKDSERDNMFNDAS